ncbi:MAG: DEAD/DEAH box helicase [Fimbriimonadaceae bacterium]|jgi:ATP-dependent exoDNAse (exonuclease V) alpha subunit|nr:DEAD/DEAH box helicase [Fimbriimonadaceae bacterium]
MEIEKKGFEQTLSQVGPSRLSPDQAQVLATVPEIPTYGRLFFVTGKAGTGKSTVLRKFVAESPLKKVVLAPTGIAAINVGGQTIHSFFGFPLGPLENTIERTHPPRQGSPKWRIMRNLDCIVIDEISMVRADLLDAMDFSLRQVCARDEPFGGKTILVFGDLWQLEPVVSAGADVEMLSHRYQSPFFFDSEVVRQTSMDIFELSTVFRQQDDEEFLYALNKLRRGDASEVDFFNSRYEKPLPPGNAIILTATNQRAQHINLTKLALLQGVGSLYEGQLEGEFGKDLPTDQKLALKIGAQVMFVKNGKDWANGTLGVVVGLGPDAVSVELESGEVVNVSAEKWEKSRYTWNRVSSKIEVETVGTYTQIPLRLAWAITVHKSQGLTFDRMVIDLDVPAFAHGQLYVALSRCRTLAGISLKRKLKESDCVVHERIWEFEKAVGLV